MKKIILIFLVIITFCSCTSDEVKNQDNIDVSLELSITNSNGDDLLDPKNTNSFDHSKIKLFYLVDGKQVEVFDGTKQSPRNFYIDQKEGHYLLTVFLNHSETEQYPETYIQWNENNIDIIKAEFRKTKNTVLKKTIWFNGTEVLNYEPYLKIKK